MIKANELRIGNKVSNDRCICEINHIYGMDFINCSLKTKQGNYINAHYDLIEPVPLTEEILLKCGFKPIGIDGNRWVLQLCIGEYFTIEAYNYIFYCTLCTWVEFKYFHQLQNLYFALTGSELVFSTEP